MVGIPINSWDHGKLISYGQRPLDEQRVKTLYQKLQDNPYTNLLTPGAVILQEMRTTFAAIRDNDGDPVDEQAREEWKAAWEHVKAMAYGGQHGVATVCRGFELKHRGIVGHYKDHIDANLYYFGGLDEAMQRKFVRFLVSEHQDTQMTASEKDFFDCITSLRSHITEVLLCEDFDSLYSKLNRMPAVQQESEKQEMAELMTTSVKHSNVDVDWKNFTKFIRMALRAPATWDKMVKINEMYKNFETKGQDTQKEKILKGYADKLLSKKKKGKKKKGKSSSMSALDKARRRATTNPMAQMRTLRAHVGDDKAMQRINPSDIPSINKTLWCDFDSPFDERINNTVLDMVISGELAVSEMGQRKKHMLMFGVVVDDILECCCKEVDDMVEEGEEKFDTVMRLGGFTAGRAPRSHHQHAAQAVHTPGEGETGEASEAR